MEVVFICVHIFDEAFMNKIHMIERMKRFISSCGAATTVFILGDFNFTLREEDRLNLDSGLMTGKECGLAQSWNFHFGDFAELHQPNFTRYPGGSMSGSAAKLDRIHANLEDEAYYIFDIRNGTTSRFPDELSDHIGVFSSLSVKNCHEKLLCILHNVAKTALFKRYVEETTALENFDVCIWAKLKLMKQIFALAYSRYLSREVERGALLTEEKIYWSVSALHASHVADASRFFKCVCSFPIRLGMILFSPLLLRNL